MPIIRLPNDVFRRLQESARPLVDTPASVIERLLDVYEQTSAEHAVDHQEEGERISSPIVRFETYENRNNPHVTIHRAGCSQLRKRGGIHRHGHGSYKAHTTFASAAHYAKQTALPMRLCGYCSPQDEPAEVSKRSTKDDNIKKA